MAAAANALKTLETGVTTVRDLGASNYTDIAMRDSINKGAMIGPRMFVAGYGLSKLTVPRETTPSAPARGRVRDTAEIRVAIKAQVDAGADWIKMYGSTGSFQNVTGVADVHRRWKCARFAAEVAHAYHKPIAIHSYGESGGRAAMRAGAESVEHPAGWCRRWRRLPSGARTKTKCTSRRSITTASMRIMLRYFGYNATQVAWSWTRFAC